ncbi:MAG: tRNA (adenosine(37)-N6)-threonylcarbamoyltransferase complex transferase subunit TsaD [Lachnospirales bacterium]
MENSTLGFEISRLDLKKEKIYVLGIETSCDETSASVVIDGREVLSNVISSQIEIHKKFGGVVPEIASRNHIKNISSVVERALDEAKVTMEEIHAIAVTYGPGLEGALLVGVSYAKALAFGYKKPLIPVHHIEGHIAANYLENNEIKPPFMCIVVSGGHTHLVDVKDYGKYEIIGKTRDDAAGEAYDKIARVLGLSYPGGPKIDELSKLGEDIYDFPRVLINSGDYDFSFSGLKSSVLNFINSAKMKEIDFKVEDVAKSFQEAVTDVLVTKTVKAAKETKNNLIVMAGGVSCNSGLREKMHLECEKNGLKMYVARPVLCTDNAAMIASAGYYDFLSGKTGDMSLNAKANLVLGKK